MLRIRNSFFPNFHYVLRCRTLTPEIVKPFCRISTKVTLNEMEQLNSEAWLFQPEKSNLNSTEVGQNDPKLILVFGWMDAKLIHLKKCKIKLFNCTIELNSVPYPTDTELYSHLFPHSTLLLIRTNQKMFLSSVRTKRNLLTPVLNYYLSNPTSSLLVHSFSNGGAMKLMAFIKFLSNIRSVSTEANSNVVLPARALILDSLPGKSSFRKALAAFSVPFANRFFLIRWLAYVSIAMFFTSGRIYRVITRQPDVFSEIRTLLFQNPKYFSQNIPRRYIYSKEDKLIFYKDIEEHIEDMKRVIPRGQDLIRGEEFEGSSHVGHLRVDKERYEKIIKEAWQKGKSVEL